VPDGRSTRELLEAHLQPALGGGLKAGHRLRAYAQAGPEQLVVLMRRPHTPVRPASGNRLACALHAACSRNCFILSGQAFTSGSMALSAQFERAAVRYASCCHGHVCRQQRACPSQLPVPLLKTLF